MIDCCWVSVYGFLFRTLNIAKLKKNIEKHGRGDIKDILLDVFFIYLEYISDEKKVRKKKSVTFKKKRKRPWLLTIIFVFLPHLTYSRLSRLYYT